MERKGICKNVGPCTLANKVQVITDDDAEFICTECGEPLEEVKDDPVNVDDELNKKRKTKRLIFILLAVILLAAIGFCIYSLLSGSKGPQKINLVQKELTMKVGETQVITPTVEPEGEKATFIFKPQGKIVKATSGGEITALKKGETTIIVKCEENPELRAICKITITDGEKPQPTYVEQMSIEGGNFTLKVDDTKQLISAVAPEKHDELLSWSSNNEEVATVDQSGLVKAKKAGTATIALTTDKSGKKAQVTVTVEKKSQGGTGGGGDKTYVTNANIGYGTYTGDVKPGTKTPHGHGTITYKTKRKVVSWLDIEAQPGDKYEGDFRDGAINGGGYLETRDGNVIRIQ